MNFDQRRRKRIRLFKNCYWISVTLISLLIASLLPDGVQQWAIDLLAKPWGWLGLVDPLAESLELENSGLFYFGTSGFLIGVFSAHLVANFFYPRYLEEFDDITLHPIDRAKPFDALWGATVGKEDSYIMPFLLPEEGPRHVAWTKLCDLVANSLANAERVRSDSESNENNLLFGWGILVGPSGAGKSRLAVELAAWLRRETLFTDPTKETPAPASKWEKRKAMLRTWWRIQIRKNLCGPEDPWDTGWLRPKAASSQSDRTEENTSKQAFAAHSNRVSVEERFTRLEAWRPRRPTFVLLDDPRMEDSRRTIEEFHKHSKDYSHPVLLLIVSQGIPSDLDLHKKSGINEKGDFWHQKRFSDMLVPPIDLGVLQPFEDVEIRKASAYALPREMSIGRGKDEDIARFRKKTTGHPFIVELGFLWIRQGHPLENISRNALLAERVERIEEAFEQCGLDSEDFYEAMAVATIAGSHTPVSRDLLAKEFSKDPFETKKLVNLFPHVAKEDLENEIPPVRPEIVGEAFVRHLYATGIKKKRHGEIAALAWKMNPEGTLRSSLRLGFIQGDPLSEAIQTPPENAGISNAVLACAYAKTGVLLPLEADTDTLRYQQSIELVNKAHSYILKLSETEIEEVTNTLRTLPDTILSYQYLRAQAWAELMWTLLARYIDSSSYSEETFSSWLNPFHTHVKQHLGSYQKYASHFENALSKTFATCEIERLISVISVTEEARKKLNWCAPMHGWVTDALPNADRLYSALNKVYETENQQTIININSVFLFSKQPEAIIEYINSIHAQRQPSRDIDYIRIMALKNYCYVCLVAETLFEIKKYIHDVEVLAKKYPEDRDFQLARSIVWRHNAYRAYLQDDVPLCRHCIEKIETIAKPFTEDQKFQHGRAMSWGTYAWAASKQDDLPTCRQCAEKIDAIAKPFPKDRSLQFERVNTWCVYTGTGSNRDDVSLCRKAAERTDNIAEAFPEDRDFQFLRTCSWSGYAWAASKQGDLPLCRQCVEKVEAIAEPFPEDRDFQYQLTDTWRVYTYAASKKRNVHLCRYCVEKIEAIAEPFPEDSDFQCQRAEAWEHYAWTAYKQDDLPLCSQCVGKVEAIAEPFPEERDIQRKRAQAWRHYAWTASDEDNPLCRQCVEQVESIAEPFPEDREIQSERIEAWRSLAYAASQKGDFPLCRQCVETIEAIAESIPEDSDIQLTRAQAWRHYAYAASKQSDHPLCRQCVEKIEAIANLFPDDEKIQQELTETRDIYTQLNN